MMEITEFGYCLRSTNEFFSEPDPSSVSIHASVTLHFDLMTFETCLPVDSPDQAVVRILAPPNPRGHMEVTSMRKFILSNTTDLSTLGPIPSRLLYPLMTLLQYAAEHMESKRYEIQKTLALEDQLKETQKILDSSAGNNDLLNKTRENELQGNLLLLGSQVSFARWLKDALLALHAQASSRLSSINENTKSTLTPSRIQTPPRPQNGDTVEAVSRQRTSNSKSGIYPADCMTKIADLRDQEIRNVMVNRNFFSNLQSLSIGLGQWQSGDIEGMHTSFSVGKGVVLPYAPRCIFTRGAGIAFVLSEGAEKYLPMDAQILTVKDSQNGLHAQWFVKGDIQFFSNLLPCLKFTPARLPSPSPLEIISVEAVSCCHFPVPDMSPSVHTSAPATLQAAYRPVSSVVTPSAGSYTPTSMFFKGNFSNAQPHQATANPPPSSANRSEKTNHQSFFNIGNNSNRTNLVNNTSTFIPPSASSKKSLFQASRGTILNEAALANHNNMDVTLPKTPTITENNSNPFVTPVRRASRSHLETSSRLKSNILARIGQSSDSHAGILARQSSPSIPPTALFCPCRVLSPSSANSCSISMSHRPEEVAQSHYNHYLSVGDGDFGPQFGRVALRVHFQHPNHAAELAGTPHLSTLEMNIWPCKPINGCSTCFLLEEPFVLSTRSLQASQPRRPSELHAASKSRNINKFDVSLENIRPPNFPPAIEPPASAFWACDGLLSSDWSEKLVSILREVESWCELHALTPEEAAKQRQHMEDLANAALNNITLTLYK